MGKKNDVMCDYLSKPEVFADFLNAGFFCGEKEILPQQLTGCEQVYYGQVDKMESSGERSRDIVKARHKGKQYVIMGLENQQHIHYAMPLRCLEYDVREYRKQLKLLQKKNRGKDFLTNMESGEFLSGMRKTDKLNPVVTIVFYHGKEKYDGCRKLHDMLHLEKENSVWKPYVADYQMNLITLEDIEEEKCETGLRELVGLLKCRQNKQKMKEYYKNHKDRMNKIDEETFRTISVMIDQEDIMSKIRNYQEVEGGNVDMCKAMEDWAEELRQEGKEVGIKAFVLDYVEDGKSEEQITQRLVKRFGVSEAEAQRYVKEYA